MEPIANFEITQIAQTVYAELLDAERRQRTAIDDSAFQIFRRDIIRAGNPTDETSGKCISGSGGVENSFQRKCGG